MTELTLQRALVRRTKELNAWQVGTIGLLVLASLFSAIAVTALVDAHERLDEQAVQLQQVEYTRDLAVQELGAMVLQAEQTTEPSEAEVCEEPSEAYTYIGECVVTSYCPCEICCGKWADGLTATGVPAEPGVVAVDPEVIPLGSTVVIGGQEYLAADLGVRGMAVDICAAGHQEAADYGVQTQEVWVMVMMS